jgi:hypothetical protein
LLYCVGTLFPDEIENLSDTANYVTWVIQVVDENTVPRNFMRVMPLVSSLQAADVALSQWHALLILQLAWRTNWQRREWIGQLR